MYNPVQWFEIATKDLERAKEFYNKVFGFEYQFIDMGEDKMYMIAGDPENKGSLGALISSKDNTPSTDGTIVYFSCQDVANEASRAEAAGGKVLVPKMSIGEFGFIAQLLDTEGNRIGIHSNQ